MATRAAAIEYKKKSEKYYEQNKDENEKENIKNERKRKEKKKKVEQTEIQSSYMEDNPPCGKIHT